MKQGRHNSKLIIQPKSTPRPMLVRGSLLHALVGQVNANTIALRPPRLADTLVTQIAEEGELVEDSNEAVDTAATLSAPDPVWIEILKNTQTVRIENPDDSEQYVDIVRRTSSKFRNSLTGEFAWWVFDNTDLET